MDSSLIIESPVKIEEDVQIGNEEMNYSQLREIQRRHTSRQLRQEQITTLAQSTKEIENHSMVQTQGQEQG
jgi:hypothetical protein